ncbi:hypothetical protein [Paraburkholderia phytofirmans]|jgi:hypothetical protein|uniref:hypothetical protein n=1 Tax=Paraburkholderia phytofirmans TaxID=261302 RepID=UPI0038B77306
MTDSLLKAAKTDSFDYYSANALRADRTGAKKDPLYRRPEVGYRIGVSCQHYFGRRRLRLCVAANANRRRFSRGAHPEDGGSTLGNRANGVRRDAAARQRRHIAFERLCTEAMKRRNE